MAFAFVKASSKVNVTVSPALPAFTGGNTAGNLIVVAAVAFSRTVEFITSITDTQGNSYFSAGTVHNNISAAQVSFWFANNIIGGAGTNTVTVNYSGGSRTEGYALEYSGQATSNLVDAPSFSSDNSAGASISYTVTCANAGELLVSVAQRATGGSNWTGLSGTARSTVLDADIAVYDLIPSLSGSNTVTATCSQTGIGGASIAFNAAPTTFSISGNAGTAGATVSWSGTASGSTVADGSGNYTIPNLANGPYTITPSLSNFTFSPASSNQTVSGANITGVDFTATQVLVYSVPDCRISYCGLVPTTNLYPNGSVNVNGTLTYTVETSNNPAIPPVDSRKAGAPVASGTYPQNSRTPGTFGPGE